MYIVPRTSVVWTIPTDSMIQFIITIIVYAYIYAAPGPPTNVEVVRIAERGQLTVTWEPPTSPNGVIQSKLSKAKFTKKQGK